MVGLELVFFFNFVLDDITVPVVITNKHVVNYNEKETVNFSLHVHKGESINVNLKTVWYMHENQDLCFCFAGPLLSQIRDEQKKNVFYKGINEDLIWDDKKLFELLAIEDVVMVGYPNGLWDMQNNFPIFRRGITASHPATDFNTKNIGAVDMACFPGSSGSPIFILNENGYSDKNGNAYLGAKRLIF